MSKFAAFIGNIHQSYRVTGFFEKANDASCDAKRKGYDDFCVREILNWKEHISWSKGKIGMYSHIQIEK